MGDLHAMSSCSDQYSLPWPSFHVQYTEFARAAALEVILSDICIDKRRAGPEISRLVASIAVIV